MGDPGSGSIDGHVDGRSWKWEYLRTGRWAILDIAVLTNS